MKNQIQALVLLLASHAHLVYGANVRGGIPPEDGGPMASAGVKRMLSDPRNYAKVSTLALEGELGGGVNELIPQAAKIRGAAVSGEDGPMTAEVKRILFGHSDLNESGFVGDEDPRDAEEIFAEIVRRLQDDTCDNADCTDGAECDDSNNCACKSPYIPNPKMKKIPAQFLPYVKKGCVVPASVEVDNLVPGHCGIYNQTCVLGALCQVDESDDKKRLKCFCNSNEGWVGDPDFAHRDIKNIKKWNLFGFYSCVDLDECLDPSNNQCASSDQCEDRDPGPLVSDRYACFCKAGFVASDFGPRGPKKCTDIDECAANKDLCPSGQFCQNTPGSYKCWCDEAKTKEPDAITGCLPPGEIDEGGCGSKTEKCVSIGQYCVKQTFPNAPDKENCLCMEGWIQPAGERAQCQDRNECVLSLDFKCDRRSDKSGRYSECENVDKTNDPVSTLGWEDGYRCKCSPGFTDTPNTPKGTKCIPPKAPAPAENIEETPAPAPAPPNNKCSSTIPGTKTSLDAACRLQDGRFCNFATEKCACDASQFYFFSSSANPFDVNCQKNQCRSGEAVCGLNTLCIDEDDFTGTSYSCVCKEGYVFEKDTTGALVPGGNCVLCNFKNNENCENPTEICSTSQGQNLCVKPCNNDDACKFAEAPVCGAQKFCIQCNKNDDCKGAEKTCNLNTNTCGVCFNTQDKTSTVNDFGCEGAKKFCVTSYGEDLQVKDQEGDLCSVCINDQQHGTEDTGCSTNDGTPFCVVTANNNVKCVECTRNKDCEGSQICNAFNKCVANPGGMSCGPNNGDTCDAPTPICVDKMNSVCGECNVKGDCPFEQGQECYKNSCGVCFNTEDKTSTVNDFGCEGAKKLFCVTSYGEDLQVKDQEGDLCSVCINDQQHGTEDTGCSTNDGTPFCVVTANNNVKCVECTRNKDCEGSQICNAFNKCVANPGGMSCGPNNGDTCDAPTPICVDKMNSVCGECIVNGDCPFEQGQECYKNSCGVCFNTEDKTSTVNDFGCEGAKKLFCVTSYGEDLQVKDQEGDLCSVCINDQQHGTEDTGCSTNDGTPFCVVTANNNVKCVECTRNKDCEGSQICNAFNKCVANPGGMSCGPNNGDTCDAPTPICVDKMNSVCGECIVNGDCPFEQGQECYKNSCGVCFNTEDKTSTVNDFGCEGAKKLFCVTSYGEDLQVKDQEGDLCSVCINDQQPGTEDTGCSTNDGTPFCVVTANNNVKCVECTRNKDCEGSQICNAFNKCVANPGGMSCGPNNGDTCDAPTPICVDKMNSVCGECIVNGDCPFEQGQECYKNSCGVCFNTEDKTSTVNDFGCEGAKKLFCVTSYGEDLQVKDQEGDLCSVCINDQQPGTEDTGCSTNDGTPFCVVTANNNVKCVECTRNKDCEGSQICNAFNKCVANPGGMSCGPNNGDTCDAPTPICVDKMNSVCGECIVNGDCPFEQGQECYKNSCGVCFNDNPLNTIQDKGCTFGFPGAKPFCLMPSGINPGSFLEGNFCAECIVGTSNTGCSGTTPICKAGTNPGLNKCVACTGDPQCTSQGLARCDLLSNTCVACLDDQGAGTRDTGCLLQSKPFCVVTDTTRSCERCQVDSDCNDTTKYCSNTYTCVSKPSSINCGTSPCTIANPVCVDAPNNRCGECSISSQCPSLQPECSTFTESKYQCGVCFNDNPLNTIQDKGCTFGIPGAKPFCLLPSGISPGSFLEGNFCAECIVGTSNTGCSGTTPICKAGTNPGLNKCVACTGDAQCPNNGVCDTSTNTCGCEFSTLTSVDKGCTNSARFCINKICGKTECQNKPGCLNLGYQKTTANGELTCSNDDNRCGEGGKCCFNGN